MGAMVRRTAHNGGDVTLSEAQAIAAVASTADGYCGCCVRGLQVRLAAAFPEFEWTYPVSAMVEDEFYDAAWMDEQDRFVTRNVIQVQPKGAK